MNTVIPGFHSIDPKAVQDRLRRHLSKERVSLEELLRQVRGIPEVGEWHMLNDFAPKRLSRADAEEVVARLRACTDELLGALGTPANNIDRAYKAPELDAAMRWHAAQLTDLERDFKRAFGLS
ncbi:hypothetical protein ACSQ76_01085 [Roseovarius sp. B08]|uniref:hypothetical protein n=1 Tax=Roseovarius sp. B08 TaxID=3449223 RepID=UPI003EDC2F9F